MHDVHTDMTGVAEKFEAFDYSIDLASRKPCKAGPAGSLEHCRLLQVDALGARSLAGQRASESLKAWQPASAYSRRPVTFYSHCILDSTHHPFTQHCALFIHRSFRVIASRLDALLLKFANQLEATRKTPAPDPSHLGLLRHRQTSRLAHTTPSNQSSGLHIRRENLATSESVFDTRTYASSRVRKPRSKESPERFPSSSSATRCSDKAMVQRRQSRTR